MTAFTKTITNSLRVFGPEPTEKWASGVSNAAIVWGSTKWGYGDVGLENVFFKRIYNSEPVLTTIFRIFVRYVFNTQEATSTIGLVFTKGFTNSLDSTSTVGKDIYHHFNSDLATTTTVGKDITHYYNNTQIVDENIDRGFDGIRYFYNSSVLINDLGSYKKRGNYDVIYGGVSNVVNYPRPTSFTTGSTASTSWTTGATTSTTWS